MERWIDFFVRGKCILTTLVRDNVERKEQFEEIAKFFELYEKSEEIREMSKKYNLLAKLLKIDEITLPSLVPTGIDDAYLNGALDEILTTISEIEKAAHEEYEQRQAARLAEQEARIKELQEQKAAEQPKEEEQGEQEEPEEEEPEEEIQIVIVRRVPTH